MEILDLPLMGAFIAYMTANWSRRSRVDQSRRRLRHLVAMVRAVADDAETRAGRDTVRDASLARWLRLLRAEALRGQQVLDAAAGEGGGGGRDAAAAVAGPARRFLAGLRDLFAGSDEVDRLTDAVEELERLAAPGADLDRFMDVVFGRRRRRGAGTVDMDVDPSPVADGGYRGEASGSAESIVAIAGAARLPVPGAKRKRACSSYLLHGRSASHSGVDTGEPHKRRAKPLMRLPVGYGRRRTVELAMARARRADEAAAAGHPRGAFLANFIAMTNRGSGEVCYVISQDFLLHFAGKEKGLLLQQFEGFKYVESN